MSENAGMGIGGRWGPVRLPVVLRALTATILTAAILRFVYWIVRLVRESPESLGIDYRTLMTATNRWLDGGSFYGPWQLAGPYPLVGGPDILYPPIALALFVPFTILPWILWWAAPALIAASALWRIRPRLVVLPLLALLFLYPRTQEVILWGNPTMWVLAFALAGVAWGWPGALVLIKPTLLPFGLFGIRTRGWWVAAGALGLVALVTLGLWSDWFTAISNAYAASPLYSLIDVPTMCIALVAAVGRTQRSTQKPEAGPAGSGSLDSAQ